MSDNSNVSNRSDSPASEAFGSVPHSSENFGNVPHGSEPFGTMPKPSESFRTIPHISTRKENHTLTVREAAKTFEAAGVARTERSIVNWCQSNGQGIARLDAYFDPNERKYYITPQSVELAIQEEKAKAAKNIGSEPFGTVPTRSEKLVPAADDVEDLDSKGQMKELEREVRDLMIANRAKDIVIDQMQKERERFFSEVVQANRKVGELEMRLLQLGDGKPKSGN